MSCDPNALLAAARCNGCIPAGMLMALKTSLLCAWMEEERPECGEPSDTITMEGAGTVAVNGNYTFVPGPAPNPIPMLDGYWQSTGSMIITLLPTGIWVIWDQNDDYLPLYQTPIHDFPCGPWLVAEGSGPAPTGSFFNGPVHPCGVPSNTILIDGAGLPGCNQSYTTSDGGITWFGDSDPNLAIVTSGPIFEIFDIAGNQNLYTADVFPCSWLLGAGGLPPNPTGQYI